MAESFFSQVLREMYKLMEVFERFEADGEYQRQTVTAVLRDAANERDVWIPDNAEDWELLDRFGADQVAHQLHDKLQQLVWAAWDNPKAALKAIGQDEEE